MSASIETPGRNAELGRISAETIAQGSQSFAVAARLFAPATRRSAMMLYAWCRHCDDVVDGQHLGFQDRSRASSIPAATRLADLREKTRRTFAGNPDPEPAFLALAEVVRQHDLPMRLALDHLDGFAMDVDGRRYRTAEDLLAYCYGVAGVVGVMMAMIMGVREPTTLDRACDLGIAFQLTNIARDIVEDSANARVYLPLDWLLAAGIEPAEIAAPMNRPALANLARQLVETADPYYASALMGLRDLPMRSAWAIAAAHAIYRQIGIEVMRRGPRAWDERVSTSKADKLVLLAHGARLALASRRSVATPRPHHLWQRPEQE
ncbi:phytoene/squalene synthase family protein [Consotaella salsifontis]|uniref:Phytoene synthase n=1 Tax=Consotaella salsifontis TaxID=1365950 RepID=A0A1T4L878_9HYPH|nr:phytoene/squalene synthase family protein [Consotaella salsifontis]SJZ50952.1 phytoene synthase [Consotaella salsifontis]